MMPDTEFPVYEVNITDLTNEGDGVGMLPDGKKVFVKGALPGELCRVSVLHEKSKFAFGKLVEILSESANRQEPKCPFYGACGGCSLMHMTYAKTLEYKLNKVKNCLTRIGGVDPEIVSEAEIIGADRIFGYRNHMQYAVRDGKTGFMKRGSDEFISCPKCLIEYEEFTKIRMVFEEACENFPTNLFTTLILRGSEKTGEFTAELVSESPLSHEILIRDAGDWLKGSMFASKVSECGINLKSVVLQICGGKIAKRTRSGKRVILYGTDGFTEILSGKKFKIRAGAFFQVNTEQAEKLYSVVKSHIGDEKIIYDLYCGTGSIGLTVTEDDKELYGTEIVSEAVASAKENAELNARRNAHFVCRPAEKQIFDGDKMPLPEVVIIDPPRKGTDEILIKRLFDAGPSRIIYVSCDPATLARDIKNFSLKYRVESITATELFPWSEHVETVVQLSKGSVPSQDVKVKFSMENVSSAQYLDKPATYDQIKAYVKEHSGLNVSSLYIAQVKQKYRIIERDCYNLPKSDDSRQPKCPEHKEKAIVDALTYYKMI